MKNTSNSFLFLFYFYRKEIKKSFFMENNLKRNKIKLSNLKIFL